MKHKELVQWLVRCAPVRTQVMGLQSRLFGRGSNEMLLVRGRDRDRARTRVELIVSRAAYDKAVSASLSAFRVQARTLERLRARNRKAKSSGQNELF